ncbi:MAG: hypothetical protein HN742_30925 [Lentisphaerae bacterium]|nr:hypothetical protein [Lentisphaerota bacterium]MBT4819979.1 hypothetical protein [Lentisphaerota bacterium]MBT5607945.1 hypothetical protein [Lentisphaerota bacterium]MBT7056535.1 hypothetical protein [Lentisphaerota bacterium]MBT7846326.1 hypothetical protein [Lentisphaerota bacterium]
MTKRSVILGLLLAMVASGVAYFNDEVIRQGKLVYDLLPVIVYGSLVFFLLVINPLLKRLRPTWIFSPRELALMSGLVLVGGAIASWGLAQALPTSLMMPHHYNRVNPGWASQNVIADAPPMLLADPSANESEALDGYVTGLSDGNDHIAFSDVPWYAWKRSLIFWVPAIFAALVMSLGLALIVHRQWADHEQLPYPIPQFMCALLPREGGVRGSVFGSISFWVGGAFVFLIHMNNYMNLWWPEATIRIPTQFDFSPLSGLCPVISRGGGALLFRPKVLFAVVGLAYFIASDVSFTMATGPFLYHLIGGTLLSYGILLRRGNHLTVQPWGALFAGGYVGLLLMVLYTGRHYYLNALRRGLGMTAKEKIEPHVAWAVRAVLIAAVLFTVQLSLIGVSWPFALAYAGLLMMTYIVVSRTVAETGAFFIGAQIFPGAVAMTFFGASGVGIQTLIIMCVVSSVIMCAPGWSPMPFIVHTLKVADVTGLRLTRLAKWTAVAMVACTVVTIVATIYWQYDQGAPANNWPGRLAAFPFETLVATKQRLAAQEMLTVSEHVSGWQHITQARPDGPSTLAFFVAVGLCLLLGFLRLRFNWWPLHPVCFVFLGGYQAMVLSASFFLGWLIKTGVTKYGGANVYQRVKPLMIGIIAGDLLAKLVPVFCGTIAYFCDKPPPTVYF